MDSGAAQGNNSIKMQRAMRIITTPTTPILYDFAWRVGLQRGYLGVFWVGKRIWIKKMIKFHP